MGAITLQAKEGITASEDFDRIVAQYQTEIYKAIFYRVRSEDVAEELTQQTFIQAFGSIDKLQKIGALKSWLYRIALNKIRDYFRKRKLLSFIKPFGFRAENDAAAVNDTPLENLLQKEFWNKIDRFIDGLPEKEKEIFTLRYLDNLAIKEIAAVQGRNENTVKTHLYRALKKSQNDTELQNYIRET